MLNLRSIDVSILRTLRNSETMLAQKTNSNRFADINLSVFFPSHIKENVEITNCWRNAYCVLIQ